MTFSEFLTEASEEKISIIELDHRTGESQDSFGNGKREYRTDFWGKALFKEHNKVYDFSFEVTSKGFDAPKKITPMKIFDVRFSGPESEKKELLKLICKIYNKGQTRVWN